MPKKRNSQSSETDTASPEDQGEARRTLKSGNKKPRPAEIGGPKGPEPTRYGDWEKKGRCIDF